MPNIKFSYLYRDGSNFKNYNILIFSNPSKISLSELTLLIQSRLIDSSWFYISDWKLPDLRFSNRNIQTDPSWHEFESVEYTDEPSNTPLDIRDFMNEIEKSQRKHIRKPEVSNRFEILRAKAEDLANELSNHNIIEKSLVGHAQIRKEQIENYNALRNFLLQRGANLKNRF